MTNIEGAALADRQGERAKGPRAGRALRWMIAALAAVVLLFVPPPAGATPSVNANAQLNGPVKVDIEGLDKVVTEIDHDIAQLLGTAQTQARDDIIHLLQQAKAEISGQLAQLRAASVDAINLVASRLDAQLSAILAETNSIVAQAHQMLNDIAGQTKAVIEGIEQRVFQQIQQIHANIQQDLKQLEAFVDEQLDRAYARAENATADAAFQARAFVDNAFLVGVRCLLAAALLVLVLRLAGQLRAAVQSKDHVPLELAASGAMAVVMIVLLASKPLLASALGVPTETTPPDPCASSLADYSKFLADKDVVAHDALRFEGANLEEELQRCAYLSVSSDRVSGAQQLMSGVRSVLMGLPDSVAVAAKR